MRTYAVSLPSDKHAEQLTAVNGPLAGTLPPAFVNAEGAVIFFGDAFDSLGALPEGSDYRIDGDDDYGLRMWIGGYAIPVSLLYGT